MFFNGRSDASGNFSAPWAPMSADRYGNWYGSTITSHSKLVISGVCIEQDCFWGSVPSLAHMPQQHLLMENADRPRHEEEKRAFGTSLPQSLHFREPQQAAPALPMLAAFSFTPPCFLLHALLQLRHLISVCLRKPISSSPPELLLTFSRSTAATHFNGASRTQARRKRSQRGACGRCRRGLLAWMLAPDVESLKWPGAARGTK